MATATPILPPTPGRPARPIERGGMVAGEGRPSRAPRDAPGGAAGRPAAPNRGLATDRCGHAARQLEGVAEVQRLMLPAAPPSLAGFNAAVVYQPCDESGGDRYDFLELPGGRVGLLIADVSGHGAAAAVGMAVVSATARAAPDRESPARFMGWVNAQLAAGYASGLGNFVTAFYAVLDPASGAMTYACAGHNPPLLWSAGAWRPLDRARRLPLGVLAGEQFP